MNKPTESKVSPPVLRLTGRHARSVFTSTFKTQATAARTLDVECKATHAYFTCS